MKTHFVSAAFLLINLAALTLWVHADEPKQPQWEVIFDGKNTDALRAWNSDTFPDKTWSIQDDCLYKAKGKAGNDLVTKKPYSDFELQWEWKLSKAGNSGVKYMLGGSTATGKFPLPAGVKADIFGFEYQMLDDDNHPDAKAGTTHQAGALYDLITANDRKKLKPLGQFNLSKIIVQGNHVEHWLNDEKIVEFELGSDELKAHIAKSKYKNMKGFGDKNPTAILFQDHGDEVWFKNIKIRPLPAK